MLASKGQVKLMTKGGVAIQNQQIGSIATISMAVVGKMSDETNCLFLHRTFSLRDDWGDRTWAAQLAGADGKVKVYEKCVRIP